MNDLGQWESVEERIIAAIRHGQEPNPEDLRTRQKLEQEWESSYPIAAGHYAHSEGGDR